MTKSSVVSRSTCTPNASAKTFLCLLLAFLWVHNGLLHSLTLRFFLILRTLVPLPIPIPSQQGFIVYMTDQGAAHSDLHAIYWNGPYQTEIFE